MTEFKILIIDDEKIYRDEISEFLKSKDYVVYEADKPSIGLDLLKKEEIDIVILDINLPGMDGLEVLQIIKKKYSEIEVIMITGFGNRRTIINAMRYGASDFFPKPFKLINIQTSIKRTKRFVEMKKQLHRTQQNFDLLSKELQEKTGSQIIGVSSAIKSIINLMSKIAKSDKTNVLITGESGTGKELVARGIHYLSRRKNKYFYDVNCSAVPENLFESEFFGHKKGAFTGATENKTGWFQIADKGTLFLDEIGDLQLNLQTKFLRVLEQNKIRRVGSNTDLEIDVRVITATNRNLQKLIREKKFREDLFYRFSSFIIHIPPLRERKEDIPILLEYFADMFAKEMKRPIPEIERKVVHKITNYKFPGNVRELKNMIEQAIILCEGNTLKSILFRIRVVLKLQKTSI
ncbi:MAG: sigma-54 dependent transcriptional regulator [Candidatus Cloacimonetes bacterium]|nr:sigma-54 dependent transcriptional regulator [Candidatus Cloacimonadota bacterium]